MSDYEVNKIIAEYMGVEPLERTCFFSDKKIRDYFANIQGELYTSSLDALVPVWEKLPCSINVYHLNGNCSVTTPFDQVILDRDGINTIQQTSAYATAKAILKLKEQENDTTK